MKQYVGLNNGAAVPPSPSRCAEGSVSQRQLVFFRSVFVPSEDRGGIRSTSTEEAACLGGQEGEELHLDSNVLIRYNKGPIRAGEAAGVWLGLRGNLSVEFVTIR